METLAEYVRSGLTAGDVFDFSYDIGGTLVGMARFNGFMEALIFQTNQQYEDRRDRSIDLHFKCAGINLVDIANHFGWRLK